MKATSQLDEIEIIQNPAFGAYCLWHYAKGFQREQSEKAYFHAVFLVLPIVFHQNTRELIQNTQWTSSLMLFASKVASERDNLLAIHLRAEAMKAISLRSLSLAVHSGLLSVDYRTATLWPNDARHRRQSPVLEKDVKKIASCSEKLGVWFSRLSLNQIATTLAVRF